jgi:allantoicase
MAAPKTYLQHMRWWHHCKQKRFRWGRKRNLSTSWETQRGEEVYHRSWVFLRVINRSRSYDARTSTTLAR